MAKSKENLTRVSGKQHQEWDTLKREVGNSAWSITAFIERLKALKLTNENMAELLLCSIQDAAHDEGTYERRLEGAKSDLERAKQDALELQHERDKWRAAALGVIGVVAMNSEKEEEKAPPRCLPFGIYSGRD